MSSPEVTITLGRSGQVVTKGGKRYRGEGFGNNGDSLLFSANKRLPLSRKRGDAGKWSHGINGVNGSQIAKNDLRLKLMRKRLSKKIQNIVEERGKIDPHKNSLKSIQPSMSSESSYMLPHGPEPDGSSFLRQIIPRGTADELREVGLSGKFYSHQMLAGSRARSPNQILESYSRLSPPRNFDETQKVTSMRTADVYRGGCFLSGEIVDASRLPGSPHVMMKATSQAGNVVSRAAPRSGIFQIGEEPQTVAGFLHSLGLGKYAVNFQAEEVDMSVLTQMGDKDLKEMGIPMGPRKKILLALLARMKRQAL